MLDRTLKLADLANIPITVLIYLAGARWLWNWLEAKRVSAHWQVILVGAAILFGVGSVVLQIVDRVRARRDGKPVASNMKSPLAYRKPSVTQTVATGPTIPLLPVQVADLPAIPEPLELADSEKPERAELLFAHDTETGLVWLRFLPDTSAVNEDALLLVVFGYKLLKDKNEVPVNDARMALNNSGCRNPWPKGIAAWISMTTYDPNIDIYEVGRACVERDLLYKGGLARGGVFILTERGARQALYLARDMIRRA